MSLCFGPFPKRIVSSSALRAIETVKMTNRPPTVLEFTLDGGSTRCCSKSTTIVRLGSAQKDSSDKALMWVIICTSAWTWMLKSTIFVYLRIFSFLHPAPICEHSPQKAKVSYFFLFYLLYLPPICVNRTKMANYIQIQASYRFFDDGANSFPSTARAAIRLSQASLAANHCDIKTSRAVLIQSGS